MHARWLIAVTLVAGCGGSVVPGSDAGMKLAGGGGGGNAAMGGGGGSGGGSSASGGGGMAASTPRLMLGLTLHLENKTFDAAYFSSLDAFARTFEGHGGKLTFEPRDQVVTAAAGPPQLLDWRALEARGHSVGSHAGIGGTTTTPLTTFTAQARMRYQQLAPRVNRLDHVSGNCGNVDWVAGVADAGFKFTTATTVLCLYSIPSQDRPSPYQALACNGATDPVCHSPYPSEVTEKLHPWRVASGSNWLSDDPNGPLVVFPGSGSLPCLEEEATSTSQSLPTCTFTDEDVTRALAELDELIAHREADRLNTMYWVWGSWSLSAAEQPVLERFLAAVDERVARGEVEWASLGAMYDAYLAWELTHR